MNKSLVSRRDDGREQTDGRERETFGARTAARKMTPSATKEALGFLSILNGFQNPFLDDSTI